MRHLARPVVFFRSLAKGLMFIGAVSTNPTQSCFDDTLLHVRTKILILVLAGHQRGRDEPRGRVSSPCIQFRASQAPSTSCNNLRRCPQVKPEDHTSRSRSCGKGKIPSLRCREAPSFQRGPDRRSTSSTGDVIATGGAPGLARLSSLCHYLRHRDQLHHQEELRPG